MVSRLSSMVWFLFQFITIILELTIGKNQLTKFSLILCQLQFVNCQLLSVKVSRSVLHTIPSAWLRPCPQFPQFGRGLLVSNYQGRTHRLKPKWHSMPNSCDWPPILRARCSCPLHRHRSC